MAARSVIALAVAGLLAGCATFSDDGGFGPVAESSQKRLGATPRWQRTDADREAVSRLVEERLSRPLGPDDAVQIALINNPALQSAYAELGVAEADVVAAGRLPSIRIASLRTKYGEAVEKVEQSIGIDVLGILLMPLRYKYESQRFARVQADLARETLSVAYDARRAWIEAVAAQESVRYMLQVRDAAEASAELARRMFRAGNYSRLQQMREQLFYAETATQLARAQQAAVTSRERLVRVLGLDDGARVRLPERLPDLPVDPAAADVVASNAARERLDIQASQRELESLQQSLGLVKTTRFINALEVGRARTKEGEHPFAYGWDFTVEIPLFDFGTARVTRAEALYLQGVNRLAETVVNARSETREAYDAYRTSYDTAKHYRDEIVPLRKRISEENVLRYNAMLSSVFELLADAREQVMSVNAAIDALREYWLAETDLQAAMTGAGSAARIVRTPSPLPVARAGGGH